MEGLGFKKSFARTFHDEPYQLNFSGDAENLSVEVEHVDDGRRWCASFAARFIEEITQRTGNAKKFDVFVRMLLSALTQDSDTVYLDVLTARDLEMLRRHANPQGPPSTSSASQSDKRYVILTYRGEFDKVHYPLPLSLEARSEEEALRSTVRKLTTELADARKQIADLEASVRSSHHTAMPVAGDGQRAVNLQRQNTELSDALRVAKREVEQLRAESRLRSSAGGHSSGEASETAKLKSQLTQLHCDLKAAKEETRQKGLIAKREADQAARELRTERQKSERLQAQVRKLEDDLRRARGSSARSGSADRSRPSSRTPSAERAPSRPPSRPNSQPRPGSRTSSRASSVASSRDRTPSPGAVRRGSLPKVPTDQGRSRPWDNTARLRGNSPGAARGSQRAPSPSATLSPYKRPVAGARQRTPSPQGRSRDRTPSPVGSASQSLNAPCPATQASVRDRTPSPVGSASQSLNAPCPATQASVRRTSTPLSLREKPLPSSRAAASPMLGAAKPPSSRYANTTAANQGGYAPRNGVQAAVSEVAMAHHQPGSIFGLAADLGLVGSAVPAPGGASLLSSNSTVSPAASAEDADAVCDIDARLQALQSFLKQTKHLTG